MAFDICYLASHGFAARMIFQTGLIKMLVDQGKRVCVVVSDDTDRGLIEQCAKQGAILTEFNCPPNAFLNQYDQLRIYFFEDLNGNTSIREKHELRMREKGIKFRRWLQPRFGLLFYYICRALPLIRHLLCALEKNLFYKSVAAEKFVQELSPTLVVSTYPVMHPEPQIILAASKLSIRTVMHLLSWDNITSKVHLPALCDRYIVWGPIMAEEFQQHYSIPPERIRSCGVPHFDLHFLSAASPEPEEVLRSLSLDEDLPYLFFAMSAPRFAPREIDIVERLAEMVRSDVFGAEMQLVVRPHPQNVSGYLADKSWLPRLRAIAGDRVGVAFPSLVESNVLWSMQHKDMIELSHLIASSVVVLNSGSTVSIDALVADRPVILTLFDADEKLPYWSSARRILDYIHISKLVALGGVEVATNYEDMESFIRSYLKYPNRNEAVRRRALARECAYNDGKSTERVTKALLSVM